VLRLLALAALVTVLASCATAPPAPPPAAAAPTAAPSQGAPPRTDVLVARARALRAEGDIAGARARLETALQLAPQDRDARVELADLLVAQGEDLARADELLLPVPDDATPHVHLVRAHLAEARGDDALAAAEYWNALAAADDPDARLHRAFALERLGRRDEAIAELERVRAARPGDPVVGSHLAESYEAARRLPEAEAEYRALAESQPARGSGWERLAGFYERAGREREAKVAREKARALGQRSERTLRPLLPSRN
jgi:tetratricopeptide (TPR) repeat protein